MLLITYIRWHYTQGVVDLVHIVGNFVWFWYEFFSFRLLLRTFFVPFHRLADEGPVGLDIGKLSERIIVNTLMRVVGMVLRSGIMLFGAILIVVTVLLGIGFFVIWLCAPLVACALVLFGLLRIFI